MVEFVSPLLAAAAAAQSLSHDGRYECSASHTITHPLLMQLESVAFEFDVASNAVVNQRFDAFRFGDALGPFAPDRTEAGRWSMRAPIRAGHIRAELIVTLTPRSHDFAVRWELIEQTQADGGWTVQGHGDGFCSREVH